MNKLILEYTDDIISAFAFNTGKNIESIIKQTTNDLESKNQLLEAKILDFYQKIDEEYFKRQYAEYFGIVVQKGGRIT